LRFKGFNSSNDEKFICDAEKSHSERLKELEQDLARKETCIC